MKTENENEDIEPITREAIADRTMPEYLDSLAQSLSVDGKPNTAQDIKAAAAEIRRLENRVIYLKAAEEITDQKLGNLSDAILAVINEELEAKIVEMLEDKIREALDDYDPTDHPYFGDAVDRQVQNSSVEDAVRDLLDNASVSISV